MDLQEVPIPGQRPLLSRLGIFPLGLSPPASRVGTVTELAAWIGRNSGHIRGLLLQHGAVLLRDCGVTSAEDFALVTRSLGCEGYDYVGGAAPRTEIVPGVVFTSNESPPDQAIPFHHELAQSPTPPAYILFMCEQEPASGGATPIIPSEEVADFFLREHPECAKKIEALGVRYIRTTPEVTDPTSAQGRSWKETYAVSTKEEAEAVMRRQGTSWEWLSSGDCKTITTKLPALRTDSRTGKKVFFNSVVAAFTGWNDSRNVGEKAVVFGDDSPVDPNVIRSVARFMAENEVAFKWKKGDVLILDNTITMHSRQVFEPPRRVLAALRGPPVGSSEATEEVQNETHTPIRVGILGVGARGLEQIRSIACFKDGEAIVTAIADERSEAIAEGLAELGPVRGPACAVFVQEEDLFTCDFVDAIIICTPNHLHLGNLRKAIPVGKHIFCENPLCTTVEDCEEVERMLAERDAKWSLPTKPGVFMVGMQYRWIPPIAALIERTDSHTLGEARVITIREHRFPFLQKPGNWNRFNVFTGGTLVEKATHFFDLMRRIAKSEPVSVYATGGQANNHQDEVYEMGKPDILDHAIVAIEFEGGVRAKLDLCMFAEDEQTECVRVVCTSGNVEARSPEATLRVVKRAHVADLGRTPPGKDVRAKPEIVNLPAREDLGAAGHEGATFFALTSFFDAVRGLKPVPITVSDGKLAVLIGVAAQRSIEIGQVVRLAACNPVEPSPSLKFLDDKEFLRLSVPQPMSRL